MRQIKGKIRKWKNEMQGCRWGRQPYWIKWQNRNENMKGQVVDEESHLQGKIKSNISSKKPVFYVPTNISRIWCLASSQAMLPQWYAACQTMYACVSFQQWGFIKWWASANNLQCCPRAEGPRTTFKNIACQATLAFVYVTNLLVYNDLYFQNISISYLTSRWLVEVGSTMVR